MYQKKIYELPKDQILYGSVRVDDTYCSLSGGYIDIDVNQSAGEIYLYMMVFVSLVRMLKLLLPNLELTHIAC